MLNKKIRSGGDSKEQWKRLGKELHKAKISARDAYLEKIVAGGQGFKDNWRSVYGYLRSKKGNGKELSMIKNEGGEFVTGELEQAEHFSNQFNKDMGSDAVEEFNKRRVDKDDCTMPFVINDEDIIVGLKNMKKGKSMGKDGISNDLLKVMGWSIVPYLKFLFNMSMNNCTLPKE